MNSPSCSSREMTRGRRPILKDSSWRGVGV
jgi:hypothetical protein